MLTDPTPFRPRRRSIATVALSGTLADKLEAAAAVGFDGVEVMESDLLTFDGSPADVRRIADGLGLSIDMYQPFRDFEAMPKPTRNCNLDRAERKPAPSGTPTPRRSRTASFSRWQGCRTDTRASAPQTPRCGWRRRTATSQPAFKRT